MPLDPTDQQKVRDWLTAKCGAGQCSLCTGKVWRVGETLAVPQITLPASATFTPGPIAVLISIVCDNCGHVAFLSASICGLLP
jgi:hypothetical protein